MPIDLLDYLDGSTLCPPARISGYIIDGKNCYIPYPPYHQWIKIDKRLTSCILSNDSPHVMPTIDDFAYASDL